MNFIVYAIFVHTLSCFCFRTTHRMSCNQNLCTVTAGTDQKQPKCRGLKTYSRCVQTTRDHHHVDVTWVQYKPSPRDTSDIQLISLLTTWSNNKRTHSLRRSFWKTTCGAIYFVSYIVPFFLLAYGWVYVVLCYCRKLETGR